LHLYWQGCVIEPGAARYSGNETGNQRGCANQYRSAGAAGGELRYHRGEPDRPCSQRACGVEVNGR
jgi:hypothetical protein